MKCECGENMKVSRENHRYVESGLPYVTLLGIEVRKCDECGEREVVIPYIEELHRVIARAVILKPERLVGEEVRFLRKSVGWSGVDFAKRMGVAPETVSRWETNAIPIGPQADRLLRVLVVTEEPIKDYSTTSLEGIADDKADPIKVKLKVSDSTWSLAA